jgi:hypothetical protein
MVPRVTDKAGFWGIGVGDAVGVSGTGEGGEVGGGAAADDQGLLADGPSE